MITIDCIADPHGNYPKLPGGDLLIVAGDLNDKENMRGYIKFRDWIQAQRYRQKIVIAGNHDTYLMSHAEIMMAGDLVEGATYLQDSGVEFEGLKIWGSPWTPWFSEVNPHCSAFMLPEEELKEKWDLIPDDTDILITHGPAYGILDENAEGKCCGSASLRTLINERAPRYHIFGHIHEDGGRRQGRAYYKPCGIISINCSHVDEHYRPRHEAMRIEL